MPCVDYHSLISVWFPAMFGTWFLKGFDSEMHERWDKSWDRKIMLSFTWRRKSEWLLHVYTTPNERRTPQNDPFNFHFPHFLAVVLEHNSRWKPPRLKGSWTVRNHLRINTRNCHLKRSRAWNGWKEGNTERTRVRTPFLSDVKSISV